MTVLPRSNCSVETALAVLGGRWKGVVLFWILQGKRRFGDLRRQLPNCSARMLTLQLRELEADGILERSERREGRVVVAEYTFTPFGRTVEPLLLALCAWGSLVQARANPPGATGDSIPQEGDHKQATEDDDEQPREDREPRPRRRGGVRA